MVSGIKDALENKVLLAIVFVLTYDPKSRTLEKYVAHPTAPTTEKTCENAHYEAVQFAQTPYECPASGKNSNGCYRVEYLKRRCYFYL